MQQTDPTQQSLEIAMLDQKIAGQMGETPYAYVAVLSDGPKMWGVGIAVKDEGGYSPIKGVDFDKQAEADAFVDGMNKHIGLDRLTAMKIIASSMCRKVQPQ